MEFNDTPAQSEAYTTYQSDQASQLYSFLESQAGTLLATLERYVRSAGLGQAEQAHEVAAEVLSELVVEALDHADRFDPARQPRAWLLGIGANLIKRRQVSAAVRQRREPLLQEFHAHPTQAGEAQGSEIEIFDRLSRLNVAGPEVEWEIKEQTQALLELVSTEDQQILRMAVLAGFNGEELARQLNLKPGAARVRLHRALNRLKLAWYKQAQSQQQGDLANE
jgi:RNA polymerase sigma factor (sigma-70 family)